MKDTQKKTIIYGGAFNPPTRAHAQIVQACVDYALTIDADLWILPSGDRVDKVIPTDRSTRMAYIKALLADIETHGVTVDIEASELDRQIAVETFDTVRELSRLYPDRTLVWVFGADSTETMSEWKEGRWLLSDLPKLLIERPGSKVHPDTKNATALSVHTPDVSSTEVRRRIAANESLGDLVTPAVAHLLAR